MRTIKTWLATIATLLCGITASAHDFEVGGIYYNVISDADLTVAVTYRGTSYFSYSNEYSGAVSISSTVTYNGKTYHVKSIGNDAFHDCSSLTSITIAENVTSIGEYAFFGCSSLTSIAIPEGVKSIGGNAFSLTAWYKNLPNGVIYINKVLYGYKGTMPENTSIEVKEGTISITPFAFSGCSNLISITIPESVTSIDGAFYGCNGLASFTIPESVTSIGENAFSGCSSLAAITLPESVTSIGEGAFRGCSALTDITIPEGVTSIGVSAFYNCSRITSVNIPESTMRIGRYAFSGCSSITFLNISQGVTNIEDESFSGCSSLTSINIPNGITSIGKSAFYGCNSLNSIILPKGLTSIGENAFRGCSSLFIVLNYSDFPLSKGSGDYGYVAYYAKEIFNDMNTERVGDFLFSSSDSGYSLVAYLGADCNLVLPNNYNGENYAINSYALSGNQIKSLTIGSGVLSIEENAVSRRPVKTIWLTNTPPTGCYYGKGEINYVANDQYANLSNVHIYPYLSSIFEVDGVKYVPVSPSERTCHAIDCVYDDAATRINVCETVSFKGVAMKVMEIMPYTFYGNAHVKEVTVSHLGDIGEGAFYNCDAIENVDVSNQGYIGNQAFYNCDGIKSVEVSNNGDVGEQAFYNCDALETVDVSNQGNIGSQAFFDCNGIKSIEIHNQGNISSQAFYECTGIETATLANVGNVDSEAFFNCSSLRAVTLGDSIGSLGEKIFQQCTSLEEIVIPDYVKTIGAYCFSECSGMKSAVIGAGLTNVKEYAFENCTALTDVTVGNGINTISNNAFSGCSALTNVVLGQNVATINDYAFQACSSLSKITLPQSVTKVGDYVFSGCSKLADVIIADRIKTLTLGSNDSSPLFVDCPLDSVYIGGKITYGTSSNKGYSPFYRNTSLRTVVVTDTEEQIYENEFYGCTNLKNVAIGNGVKSIGDYAFSGCSSLNEFSFGSNLENIGAEAFSDCTNLTTITSHAAVPPTCGNQALDDINKWSCVLRVPQSYAAAYQAADQWKEFFFIEDVVEVKKYALTYMVDGEVYYTDSLAHKETITTIAEPVKEGYTFSGWNKTVTTMPAEDVVINGTFTINTYKVEYVVDGETYRTDEVAYNDTLILVEEPTKEGHTFSGWSEAPETMPASDVIISGTFTVNKYLVTFKIGDEVIAADSLEYGATIVAPEAPEKEGYTFDGWGEVAETVPAGNVTYEGTYTVNIYKVYYYVGEELVHTAEVAYGEAIPEYVYEPTEAGYTFLGWIGDTYETMPAHDVTYTANIDDAIEQLTIDNSQLTIYDLSGRKVLDTENLKGGIYIVNGRKVIVK